VSTIKAMNVGDKSVCSLNQYTMDIHEKEGDEERPGYRRVNGYPTAIRWTLQQ